MYIEHVLQNAKHGLDTFGHLSQHGPHFWQSPYHMRSIFTQQ